MDVRSVAVDIVPDVLRREDSVVIPPRDARPQLPGSCLPSRLLLDEAIRMVRIPLPFSSFMLDHLDSLLFRSSCAIRCSFTFDPDNFPDPKAYLSEIKEKYGVKICVWSA